MYSDEAWCVKDLHVLFCFVPKKKHSWINQPTNQPTEDNFPPEMLSLVYNGGYQDSLCLMLWLGFNCSMPIEGYPLSVRHMDLWLGDIACRVHVTMSTHT